MQRCCIAQWHDMWKRSGKTGMSFRSTSVQDDPACRTTQLSSCFLIECYFRWTARELAAEVWVCHKTVLHILGYRKLAAGWIPHKISELQHWHGYGVAQALFDQYQREGDDFLGRIDAMDETWARSYEPNLKRQSNEWKHPSSPRPKKVRPTQRAINVMFIVVYATDEVILHHVVPPGQTVKAATPPSLRRKQWNLLVQNPIILHDNARNHTASVTDILCRLQWEI